MQPDPIGQGHRLLSLGDRVHGGHSVDVVLKIILAISRPGDDVLLFEKVLQLPLKLSAHRF